MAMLNNQKVCSAIAAIPPKNWPGLPEVRRLGFGDGLVPIRDGCVWVVLAAEMMWIWGHIHKCNTYSMGIPGS